MARVTQNYLNAIIVEPKKEHVATLVPIVENQRAKILALMDRVSELEAVNSQQAASIVELRGKLSSVESELSRRPMRQPKIL